MTSFTMAPPAGVDTPATHPQPDLSGLFDAGCVLKAQRKFAEALQQFFALLEHKPNEPDVLTEAAKCLLELGHSEDAAALMKRAVGYEPWNAPARILYGHILGDLGRHREAYREYQEAVRLTPDAPLANWNLALFELAAGDWASGWRRYEWGKTAWRRPSRHRLPEWNGRPTGTLYVWAEQGLGDTLMCLRFLASLRRRWKIERIVLEVQESLVDLAADFPGVDAVYKIRQDGSFGCPFNDHVSLMSLPKVLSLQPISLEAEWSPYLAYLGERVTKPVSERPRVGFCWKGSPTHPNDRHRSLSEEQAEGFLASVAGVDWVNLTPGGGLPGIQNPVFPGWRDTAELIATLDAVVSVDTAVAHLAGAMGKPLGLLLAHVGDFRWGWEGKETPWYPSARLFRQTPEMKWEGPLKAVADWAQVRGWMERDSSDTWSLLRDPKREALSAIA